MKQRNESERMNKRKYYRSSYYVQGSNALKMEAAPDRSRRTVEERKQNTTVKSVPSQAWDVKSLLFIAAAVVVTFLMCISYLEAQENVTVMSKKAASLESEILNLKNENDAAYSRINSSVDLQYVYDVAVNELGMVHAKDSQVIPYNSKKSNSVRQYGEIPDKTEETYGLTKEN